MELAILVLLVVVVLINVVLIVLILKNKQDETSIVERLGLYYK